MYKNNNKSKKVPSQALFSHFPIWLSNILMGEIASVQHTYLFLDSLRLIGYRVIYPSEPTIAENIGYSERQVCRAVDRLRRLGLIETKQRYRDSLIYQLHQTKKEANLAKRRNRARIEEKSRFMSGQKLNSKDLLSREVGQGGLAGSGERPSPSQYGTVGNKTSFVNKKTHKGEGMSPALGSTDYLSDYVSAIQEPEIYNKLYIDEAHARAVGMWPLFDPSENEEHAILNDNGADLPF